MQTGIIEMKVRKKMRGKQQREVTVNFVLNSSDGEEEKPSELWASLGLGLQYNGKERDEEKDRCLASDCGTEWSGVVCSHTFLSSWLIFSRSLHLILP